MFIENAPAPARALLSGWAELRVFDRQRVKSAASSGFAADHYFFKILLLFSIFTRRDVTLGSMLMD